ncbi:unnamed protein product [Sphenostylis stenocarpa]|uniref:Uncharacterized protein n=1 Tax=Sphenostylis stenocarpa TaxID=92480 RepID=A0AA86VKN4_9FABA|nr:unnamed protein product [Sphenostylis stenocarpa]
MDFHEMKRKRLQALCKKHGIPANLRNSDMADRLSFLFKEKEIEDPVGSGNAGTKKDTTLHCVGGKIVEMIDLVTPSPGLKERSVLLAKHLKGSEIERLEFELNLSPEITREEFGICGVEEDMKSRLNKEHVDSQGGLHLATVAVVLDEFNNHFGEEEVEKLSDKNNLIGNGRDKAEEQGDHNRLQGSNMKDVNALHASKEESGSSMVEEDKAIEQGDCISPQGSIMKDVQILHISQKESDYLVVEKDEAVEQGDHNSPQGSNMKDKNTLHASEEESSFPMVEEDSALEQGDHNSSQGRTIKDAKILHVSQEESGYPVVEKEGDHKIPQGSSMKDVNILHASEEESGFPMVEEDNGSEQGDTDHNSSHGPSMTDVNVLHVSQEESDYRIVEDVGVEQGDTNIPQGPNMKDVNVLDTSQEESGDPIVEEGVDVEQGDQNSPQGPNMKEVNVLHVCLEESMAGEEEAVEQGDHNSPRGSNLKDVNVMHISQEEFGHPMVEEVQKSNDNICNGNVYNLLNTESEVDAKKTDGKTNLTAEHSADDVLSSLNQYSVGTPDKFQKSYPENDVKSSGLNIHQDNCEEELKSPQKMGSIADPVECIGFSPYNLEASVVESFQSETYFYPSTLGDVGTCNMKESMQSYKMEKAEYSQEALHTSANVNLLLKSMEECNMHTEQGEVIGLFDDSNVQDDDAINGRSEIDTRCLDMSIRAINKDGKTNLTVEQFTDELQSSTFEDSDGTPVQFLSNDALSEVKSDFNIHELVVSGIVIENVDNSKTKFISSRKISLSPASERMIDFSANQLNNSETKALQFKTIFFPDTARVDNGIGDVEENMQLDVNQEQVDDSQQLIHAASCVMDLNNEDFVQGACDEVGDYLLEEEIKKSGFIADSKEVDIGICDVEENIQIHANEKQVDESQHATSSVMILKNVDLVQVALVEVGDHLLEGEVEKSGLNADSEECIEILSNNLLPSATKGFEDETYCDRTTLGDVVETCKMEERMPSDQMEKEYSQEVLHRANELVLLLKSTEESDSVLEEITRLFNNSDDHEDDGVTGAENGKNQYNMKRDMDGIEKYLLNDFHSIHDASGQNSDENAPTMSQHGEMKLSTFNLQKMSASGTFCGDELETPPKCTPIPKLGESSMKKELKIVSSMPVKRARDILGASDMKENNKISKKEQVGTIISRTAFPKRKPLQDLQQN